MAAMSSNRLALCGFSLGQYRSHGLDKQITVAAQNGFAGIKVVFSDPRTYAEAHNISML